MRPHCVIDDGGNATKCQNHIEQQQITHFETEVASGGQPNSQPDFSSGGVGKSTIVRESLINHLRAIKQRGEKLPEIVVWPGYEDTLLKLQLADKELRDCFRTPGGVSSYHATGLPFTSSECVDAILREAGEELNKYPEPFERGATAVEVLRKREQWLLVDGCEFHHDPSNPSYPKTDTVLSGVLQKARERHDGFKAIVISRSEVPELRGIAPFFVSLPTNEAIADYLETELEIPVKADFARLLDTAGGDRRPLLWRAVAEYARTAFEVRFQKPWKDCSNRSRGKTLEIQGCF